jgi:hypothetical protein
VFYGEQLFCGNAKKVNISCYALNRTDVGHLWRDTIRDVEINTV